MHETGFWWTVGDYFYKFFHALEWTYNNLSPNKVFIFLAFACFIAWMIWQHSFNKKALKDGTYK